VINRMKLIQILVFVLVLSASARSAWCQSCAVAVQADVLIDKAEVTLADLLTPGSCPVAIEAASRIRVGAAPFGESARVLDRADVRGLFQKLESILALDSRQLDFARVPERVVIHRAHGQSSCHEVEAQILASPEIANLHSPKIELDCEAASRIPRVASIVLTRKNWDAALQSWDFVAHCTPPGECIPFLVRVHSSRAVVMRFGWNGERLVDAISPHGAQPNGSPETFLVRPGDHASVVWDQGGIRLTAPAICMDKGRRGDSVRARFEHGGVVRAIVVDSKSLRVQS
jgi:hypothetical protein